MSIVDQRRGQYQYVKIQCDGPGPIVGNTPCPEQRAWSDHCTAKELRGKTTGWRTGLRFGYDQCPRCKHRRGAGYA